MLELVVDRSENDLLIIQQIIQKPSYERTVEEEELYNSCSAKGSYNFTDLNRVTEAMEYIVGKFREYGYQVPGYKRIQIEHADQRLLPEGYTQLGWIESTGTQYIDTGVVPNGETKVIMDFQLTNPDNTNQCLFGTAGQFSFRWFGNQGYFRSNGKENSNFPTEIDKAARHTVEKTATACTIDQSYTVSNTAGDVTLSLTLFGQHGATDILNFADVKCYSIEIYSGDELVRNYIPCKNPSGEVGLYDLVGQQFYGNAGTGNFIGSPVPVELPDGYTQVEYIRSSGTQYIDTAFKPDQDTKIIIDAEIISGVLYGSIFGARNSSSSGQFNLWPVSSQQWGYDYGTSASLMVSASSTGRHIFTADGPDVSIDEQSQAYGQQTFQTNNNLYLLTINLGGSTGEKCNAKVYSCKIYDNGTLVRDYVPAENESGTVGLYDLVNDVFYTNSGTGVFVAGSTVKPPFAPPTYEELDPYTWYEQDVPTISLMGTYLDNVTAIRAVLELLPTTPETPETMAALTWVGANDIERILVDVQFIILRVVNAMARSNSFTFWSGNLPFPTAESNLGRTWAELDAMETTWANWQVATWYLLLYGNLEAEGVVN